MCAPNLIRIVCDLLELFPRVIFRTQEFYSIGWKHVWLWAYYWWNKLLIVTRVIDMYCSWQRQYSCCWWNHFKTCMMHKKNSAVSWKLSNKKFSITKHVRCATCLSLGITLRSTSAIFSTVLGHMAMLVVDCPWLEVYLYLLWIIVQ